MNHIYRLIWDELRCAYVAVAEIAKRRGKRAGAVVRAAAAVIAIGGLPLSVCAMDAGTLPSGAQVVSGDVQLNQQGANLTVHQDSQRAIVNWTSFDIGSQASVRFEQPDSSAIALNRVLGGSPSQILGGLSANGQVWLVNPNGVFFGKGAQVDVGGLVVSSLSISDNDFLAGRARFAAAGGAGAVRNEGMIRAHGGVVAMLAPVVGNAGTIAAGQVGLAAGHQVALDFSGDGMLSLAVEPDKLKAEIAQSGLIRGNNVVLSAAAASALHSSVINMDGVIEATDLGERGGHILLDGGDGGQVHVSGRLDASSAAGTGGRIDVLGDRLVLDDGAQLDVSGANGGGTIHVGGGWHGADASLRNATSVDVDGSVTIKAGASATGDGGEVVFWSDDSTRFAGQIDIRGGAQGGNGGRAEVSGKQLLNYTGMTNASAVNGAAGDLWLDPATITIYGGSGTNAADSSVLYADNLEAQAANVNLTATGNINFADLSLNGGDGTLSLGTNYSLRLEAGTGGTGYIGFANSSNTIEVSGTGSIYLQAGGSGTGGVGNSTATGYKQGVANLVAHGTGNSSDSASAVSSFFGGAAAVGSGTPGAGSITLLGADGLTLGGTIATGGGYVRIWADSDNAGGGSMVVNKAITTNGGNLYIAAGNTSNSATIALNSDLTLGTGRLFFHKDGTQSNGPVTLNGLLTASGDVNITTAFTMGGRASIYTDGNINFGAVNINLNTGSGVLVLRANAIDWGSANLQNLSTASMRLEPYDKTTSMVLGDASGFASAATLAKLPGIKNLTIGREDGTGTISVSGDYTFNATGSFELVNRTVDISLGSLATTGNVILTGDNINIGKAVTAKGGTGKVTIRQSTATNDLHLGTGLSNASIGEVNAATLEVGRSDGGNLVFDSDITTSATTVHLKSGNKVIGVDGGVSASSLAITAGGGATITDDTFDFTTLALSVGGDSDITSSSSNWSLGTVDGLAGLGIQSGRTATVALEAQDTLGLNAALNFNDTASTLEATAGTSFAADSAVVSGQSQATAVFALDNSAVFALGGTGTALSATALARFGGVDTLRIAAQDIGVTVGAFDVSVGNRMQIDADTLQQLGAMKVGTGSLYLGVAHGGLQLDHAVTATNTVSLEDAAGAGIAGSGTISAAALALRSTGTVELDASTHQVDRIAAEVGNLAFTNGRSLHVGSADGLDGINASGIVDVRAIGASADLILDKVVKAGNAGKAQTGVLLAAGRNFHNNAGATAVATDEGRWLVYSTSPLSDTRGALAAEFKQYAAGLASTVLDAGNGFLYTVAPTIAVALTGTADKVYDGNDTAGVGGIGLTLSGAIDGDTVVVAKGTSAHYDDRNVGSNKTVSMNGLAIDSAGNAGVRVYGYALASTSASGDIGKVTPKTISLGTGSIQDKVYDGSTSASLGSVTLDGVVDGDTVSFTSVGSIAFDDRNAGNGKQVNLAGVVLGGIDAGNYTVDGKAYADIDRRVLSVGVAVDDKVYDGTTGATLSGQSLHNTVAGDDVSLHAGAAFADKNVGAGKSVVVTASLGGADAGNYVLDATTSDPRASTASITPKTIDAGTLSVTGKVYDGDRDATVNSTGLVGVVAGDDLSLVLGGQYDNKNVGTGKHVDVTLGLDGGDAGNYQLSYATAISSGAITPKIIDAGTLSVTGKVYDGNRDATVNSTGLVGVVAGDDLSLVLGGQYDDKNAGTGKRVDVSLGLNGGDASNYQLSHATAISSGAITPRTIDAGTLSVTGKVYDGNRNATVKSSGLVGAVAGDDLSLDLTGQYDDKNVGTGKRVDVTLGLDGGDAGNYQLVSNSATSSGNITPKTIDAGTLSVTGKVYDGRRDATVTSTGPVGVVTGDDLSLDLTGQYDDKNVGTGKQVDVALGLSGDDAGNYELVSNSATSHGDITPKTIDAGTLSVSGKVYDGNRDATVHSTGLVGVVTGDDLTLDLTGQYGDKNVGTGKRVDVTLGLDGGDAGNYQLVSNSATSSGDITPKTIDAGTLSITGKVYDGKRDATVTSTGPVGVVTGDDLSLDLTGQYDDKNVGTGKQVDVALGLSGDDAGNYELVSNSATSHGDITPKTIDAGTLSVSGKVYDGNRDATVTSTGPVGVVTGDDLSLDLTGRYDDKNVGTGKVVDVSLGLSGDDAGNYQLVNNSATSHGDITPKTIDAGTLSVSGKVYDGNRDATVTSTGPVGVVTGDDLSLDLTGQYDDKNVGTGKVVDVSLGLSGDDAGNYQLLNNSATSHGNITPKTIDSGTLSVAGKVYDGNRDATVASTGLVGVVTGDDLSLDLTGQYDDKNVGTGKQVDVALGLSGDDAGNYQLVNNSATSHGNITPKTIDAGTLSVTGKVYDGNRDATVHSSGLVGVVAGDDLSLVLGGQYDDKNAGIGKQVDVTLGLDGADARNYRLAETSAQEHGDVAAKALVVGPVGVVDKRFDGNRDAELVLPALRGVVQGDDVVLRGQGLFDSAGTAASKTVQIALSLDGADAGNYVLVDARQQASAGVSDLPGRNAVDAVMQPPAGSNGTQPGTNDIGAGNSPGAIAAANGAMGKLTGSARPEPGGSWSDPSASAEGADASSGSTGSAASAGSAGSAAAGSGAQQGDGMDGDVDAGSREGAGAGAADFATEQMLRNGASVSLASGGEALAKPQSSELPVFAPDGESLGRFRVDDLGNSLALHPVSGGHAAAPDLQHKVRARTTTRVKLDADDTVSLRMELLEDGTLRIHASANAARLGTDAVVAYGLSALKRHAGISPSQVRAVVLGFDD